MKNSDDSNPPIIWKDALEMFDDDEDMLKLMLESFHTKVFDQKMKSLSDNMQQENWTEVFQHSHALRGVSTYISAYKFSDACRILRESTKNKNREKIYAAYDKVLEESKILIIYIAKLLEKIPNTIEIEKYILAFEQQKKEKKKNTNSENNNIKNNKQLTIIESKDVSADNSICKKCCIF